MSLFSFTPRKFDWLLFAIIFVLIAIGLAAIYSVDLSRGEKLTFFSTQSIAFVIGFVVLLISSSLHFTVYKNYSVLFYIFCLLILVLVLFFGSNIKGTTGWFRFAGFSFQPVEVAKIGLVFFLAWLTSRYGRNFYGVKFILASGLATLILVVPILMQPDMGSAMILFFVWFGTLLLVGIQKRYIFFLLSLGAVVAIVGWMFLLKPYQKERVLTFIDPERDPLGTGYNVSQSMIAIGAGQFFGRGLGLGSQSQLHFLPEAQTDFIFSVISEELGFLGGSMVLVLELLLFWRLQRIVKRSNSEYGAYVVSGIILLFLGQLVLNVGGATGLLPITGVTLPFVSYGGSSLILSCFAIGITQSISAGTTA